MMYHAFVTIINASCIILAIAGMLISFIGYRQGVKRTAFVLFIVYFVAVFLATLLSGCATVYMRTDFSGSKPKGLYPATRTDVEGGYRYCANKSDSFGGWRGAGTSSNPNILEKFLWVTFSVIDLPISLVTDTLWLPSDLSKRKKNKGTPTKK